MKISVIKMLAGVPDFFPSNHVKLKREANAKGVAAAARDASSSAVAAPVIHENLARHAPPRWS